MPAGHDEELATIFREMRRAAGVTREKIAGRLATEVQTIDALENGAILALPPWQETSRIVTAYAAQLGLDSRPILRRLQAQMGHQPEARQNTGDKSQAEQPQGAPAAQSGGGPPMPPGAAAAPGAAPQLRSGEASAVSAASASSDVAAAQQPPQSTAAAARQAADSPPAHEAAAEPARPSRSGEPARSGLRERLGSIAGWLVLVVFVAGLGYGVWSAVQRPQMVWTVVDNLPDPMPTLTRAAWELMRPLDVDGEETGGQAPEPGTRKGDKLP